jgi:hypothetical protein
VLPGSSEAGEKVRSYVVFCRFARSRLATRFSALPATINSWAAGLNGGKAKNFPVDGKRLSVSRSSSPAVGYSGEPSLGQAQDFLTQHGSDMIDRFA